MLPPHIIINAAHSPKLASFDRSKSCSVWSLISSGSPTDNPASWRHALVFTGDLFCVFDPVPHQRPSPWKEIIPFWDSLMMTCVLQSPLFILMPTSESVRGNDSNGFGGGFGQISSNSRLLQFGTFCTASLGNWKCGAITQIRWLRTGTLADHNYSDQSRVGPVWLMTAVHRLSRAESKSGLILCSLQEPHRAETGMLIIASLCPEKKRYICKTLS